MKRLAILLKVLFCLCVSTTTLGKTDWVKDFELAKELAQKEDKLILVNFSADRFDLSRKLKEEIFSKPKFKTFAKKNIILLMIDFSRVEKRTKTDKRQNVKLAKGYKVKRLSTVLILDNKGGFIAKNGYTPGGPDAYIKSLTAKLRSPNSENINRYDIRKRIKQINALAGNKSRKTSENNNSKSPQNYSEALPLIPAYELIDNWKKYLNKAVVVTGMLSKTGKSAKGRRVILYKGRLQCFPRDNKKDRNDFEAVGKCFEEEKKRYCNKTDNYRDSLSKLTIKGLARRGVKPGTILLEECEILRRNIVHISGSSRRKEGGLSFLLGWARLKNEFGYNSRRKDPATLSKEEQLIGVLTLSKNTMKDRRINLDKNKTVFMGEDPFSFMTEVHEINTILKRKGWKAHLELTLKVKKDTGAVRNKHACQYSNGQILSWRSLSPEVKLYSIVNDQAYFRSKLGIIAPINIPREYAREVPEQKWHK